MISATNLTFGATHDAVSSTTTASITPTANNLVLVTVVNASSGTPTLSGNGMTWTQIDTNYIGTSNVRITMFRGLSASPSAGAITITLTGTNNIYWVIDQFSGMTLSGTNGSGAIIQDVIDNNNTFAGGTQTITLATFKGSSNSAYGVVMAPFANSIVKGANFTELQNATLLNGIGGATKIVESQYSTSAQTAVNWTINTADSGLLSIAVEISVPTSGFFELL